VCLLHVDHYPGGGAGPSTKLRSVASVLVEVSAVASGRAEQ
jgi:hypothetical protein